jgi:hypothetical protein
MTIKNPIKRKAEIKKAAPSIYKSLFDFAIGIIVGWSLAHYAVDSFEGLWPAVGMVTVMIELLKEFGLIGVGGVGVRLLFEVYRKRNE